MTGDEVTAVAVAVAAGGWAVDRVMLWAEGRGWVYWRHRSPSSTSWGNAMLSVHALLEPDVEHVVEERYREAAHIEVPGDDEPEDVSRRRTSDG